jgi:pimeloyl-ACP methyl ester carboxylesterase
MKNLLTLTFISLITFSFGQDILGSWNGALKVQGIELRLVFNITKTGDGYQSTMDSPDQGAKGIPVATTIFEGDKLTISMPNMGIEYKATLVKADELEGTFKQAGQSFPMNLSKKAVEQSVIRKPQEPVPPFSYRSEEVTFMNKVDNVTLSGTLTLPKKKGNYPVVVLISGSGPQNRDGELLGHKPFLVISDYLTKNGIGVLRFDDRGTAKSTGDFSLATSFDFSKDVEAAVAYLLTCKEVNKEQIGLIGHSEGGLIAPMVAARNEAVKFIVLLAAPGQNGDELLLTQQQLIGKASGVSEEELKKSSAIIQKVFELIKQSSDPQQLKSDIHSILEESLKNSPESEIPNGMSKAEFISLQVQQITSPWMTYFIKSNPTETLKKVTCPVLALNGEKDVQVAPKENIEAIQKALSEGGNSNLTTKIYPNLNHLFQHATTGSPAEYAIIEETFSEKVLKDIVGWIKKK